MDIWTIFPAAIRGKLEQKGLPEGTEEIRVRVGQPLEFRTRGGSFVVPGMSERMTAEELEEALNYICSYSLYAYREQMRCGYVTIEGGHRIGLAGEVVTEQDRVTGFRHVTFLNIRIAAEHIGCANAILPFLYEGERLLHTLIFSAPGAGKTTLLRDCIRQISCGTYRMPQKVGVVDERFELAACHLGVPQNDIGAHTDVLCGCDKRTGISMLLRTMSPQVIAVDELGGADDARSVEEAMYCGCSILGTVHAGSMEELKGGTYWRQNKFERYIGLSRMADGRRAMQVYDKKGELLWLPQS